LTCVNKSCRFRFARMTASASVVSPARAIAAICARERDVSRCGKPPGVRYQQRGERIPNRHRVRDGTLSASTARTEFSRPAMGNFSASHRDPGGRGDGSWSTRPIWFVPIYGTSTCPGGRNAKVLGYARHPRHAGLRSKARG
jgi:hypothetical protein